MENEKIIINPISSVHNNITKEETNKIINTKKDKINKNEEFHNIFINELKKY